MFDFFFLEMKKDLFLFCFLVSALSAYVSKLSKHSAQTFIYIILLSSSPMIKEPNGIKHQPRGFQEVQKASMCTGNLRKGGFIKPIK